MAAIPQYQDPTLAAADRVIEETANGQPARPYLGMSGVGEECERKLWYQFRWAGRERFTAVALKRFEDGHRTEDLILDRLRRVPGIELYTVDPETGRQFEVTDFGGHFSGHLDAALRGLIQAPKAWHVGEVKATEHSGADKDAEDATQKDLLKSIIKHGEKNALKAWNMVYYVQAILYMDYTGMDRHYLVAATPGGRDWISVRTDADPVEAIKQKAKARRVIFSPRPLQRMSDNPDFYKCGWCAFAPNCHKGKLADSNCRTCLHSTPTEEGTWHCARWNKVLTVPEQRAGCEAHLYIPDLVGGEQIDASEAGEWVSYRMPDGSIWTDGAK